MCEKNAMHFRKTRHKRLPGLLLGMLLFFLPVLPARAASCQWPLTPALPASAAVSDLWREETPDYTDTLLEQLDFGEIDTFLQQMDEKTDIRFSDVIRAFVQGSVRDGLLLFRELLADNLFAEWKTNKTTLIHVVMIALIAGSLIGFSDIFENRQISEVCYYMVYVLLLTILMKAFGTASGLVEQMLARVLGFMKVLMPSFVLALGLSGGTVTGAVFLEWVLLLISVVEAVMEKLLLPTVHLYVLLMLVNQMTKEDILSKMAGLFRQGTEMALKGMTAAVLGFNLVQGLIAPAVDGFKKDVVTKTAGMLPGVGQVFDSVSDLVLGAGVLIRNSIGAAGLVFLAVLCLIPLAKVALFAVSYQLAAAVVQPVSDSRIVACISSVGDGMVLLMKVMFTATLLFWLTLAVVCVAMRA